MFYCFSATWAEKLVSHGFSFFARTTMLARRTEGQSLEPTMAFFSCADSLDSLSSLIIAFFASSQPAKFIAPRGAIQKKRGIAPLNRPRGPSLPRMDKTIICIDTGVPGGAVIIRVFITSKGVVTTAASPPDNAPTATISHGSKSLFATCCATYKTKAIIIIIETCAQM